MAQYTHHIKHILNLKNTTFLNSINKSIAWNLLARKQGKEYISFYMADMHENI